MDPTVEFDEISRVDGNRSGQKESPQSISQALARLENVYDWKMSRLKRELAVENKVKIRRVVKPMKTDKKHVFKREGNQEQFNHQTALK